jgi:alpha-beta hydrolase superfamily lysophospholipase
MTALPITRTFEDRQGISVTYYEWPVANPQAIIQLVHGLGEHANRYAHLIKDLNRAGYHVYATDHRGHGQTGVAMRAAGQIAKQGQLGAGGMNAVFDDERQLTDIIAAENPGAKLVILGQSWGSLIIQRLLDTDSQRYAAAVLTGTSLAMPGTLPNGGNDAKFVPAGTKPLGGEWLSRKPGIAEAFRNDPLNFPETAIQAWGFGNALKVLGKPKRGINPDLPILQLAGTEDQLGGERGNTLLQKAYLKAGVKDSKVILYHGARHEVFNETNYEEVLADLLGWLADHLQTPEA